MVGSGGFVRLCWFAVLSHQWSVPFSLLKSTSDSGVLDALVRSVCRTWFIAWNHKRRSAAVQWGVMTGLICFEINIKVKHMWRREKLIQDSLVNASHMWMYGCAGGNCNSHPSVTGPPGNRRTVSPLGNGAQWRQAPADCGSTCLVRCVVRREEEASDQCYQKYVPEEIKFR
jgi:hypothetical protein